MEVPQGKRLYYGVYSYTQLDLKSFYSLKKITMVFKMLLNGGETRINEHNQNNKWYYTVPVSCDEDGRLKLEENKRDFIKSFIDAFKGDNKHIESTEDYYFL